MKKPRFLKFFFDDEGEYVGAIHHSHLYFVASAEFENKTEALDDLIDQMRQRKEEIENFIDELRGYKSHLTHEKQTTPHNRG